MSSTSLENGMTAEFPTIHLCPKNETGVLNFLAKNPEADGRGTVIAIFDSGVDPGAPGLKVTSTGLPKVIERYDASGSGDVDTTTVVKKDKDNIIAGLTERKLKVPQTWQNPTGEFHVGVKPLFELYGNLVKGRIEAKRKEENWDPKHRLLIAEANRKLTKEQNGNKLKAENLSSLEKLENEETEAQLDVLQTLEKKYKDPGPVLDCVVWNDGTEWNVCLATDEDLENGIVLREYKLHQEYAPLSKLDQTNVSVNVHDNGNLLEIVSTCGSHGTHVSSIAAGYFPENPDLNGVAPGAQIISFQIGDCRLDSMETGTALVRAMGYVMQNAHRIHVINMSYGEVAHWTTIGRIGELMKEVIDKYGVTWVCSAGNRGPALSTVGTPPWIAANNVIGVGAYVSPDMMSAEYSLRQKLPGMPYSWTSRGPCMDGELGVSVCAPGGAITSVPNFTLRSAQLMNGTSMAAPHVAGCVALILSAALKKDLKWSPFSVKKALENSAISVPHADPFAQGHGLVQVEKAFQVLEELSSLPERDVRFDISVNVPQGGGSAIPMKSIYIRDPPVEKSKEYTVSVEPVFFKPHLIDPVAKIQFRLNLCLISSQPWVHAPKFVDMANAQRSFNVKVDVEGLPKGVHFAKLSAFDVNRMDRGAVFHVFVTAIVPEQLSVNKLYRPVFTFSPVTYSAGQIQRYFFQVPKGSSWAVLNLKLGDSQSQDSRLEPTVASSNSRFVIHAISLASGESCRSAEFYKMVSLNTLEESVLPLKVKEGKVLELVIARWWAEPTETSCLSGTLTFRGLSLNTCSICIPAINMFQKVSIQNTFGTEEVQPAAALKHQVVLLRPTESRIVALAIPRDTIPESRVIYQLENTYNFSVSRSTEATFNCCLLSDTLYEAEYESQLWQLFDKNKRYLACGDAYPSKWSVKLEKGDYVLRFHLRHEKRDALEKFVVANSGNGSSGTTSGDTQIPVLPMLMSLKLPSSINLDVFQNEHELQDIKSSKKASGWSTVLKRESNLNLFISALISDKNLKSLPSTVVGYLQGTLTIHKDEHGKKVINYPLKITLPEVPSKPKSGSSKDPSKSKLDEMNEQLRDLQINWVTKLDSDDSKALYEKLVETYDSHLPVHTARLQFLDGNSSSVESSPTPSSSSGDVNSTTPSESDLKKKVKTPETCREIIQIADKVINMIDQPVLLAYYGTRASSIPDAAKTKQSMEKQKTALTDALLKKGVAMAELLDAGDVDSEITLESIDEILFDIQKYLDIYDPRVLDFAYKHAMARKHYSRALKLLLKYIEAEPGKWNLDVDRKFIATFEALNWQHCVWLWKNMKITRYPKCYRPF